MPPSRGIKPSRLPMFQLVIQILTFGTIGPPADGQDYRKAHTKRYRRDDCRKAADGPGCPVLTNRLHRCACCYGCQAQDKLAFRHQFRACFAHIITKEVMSLPYLTVDYNIGNEPILVFLFFGIIVVKIHLITIQTLKCHKVIREAPWDKNVSLPMRLIIRQLSIPFSFFARHDGYERSL